MSKPVSSKSSLKVLAVALAAALLIVPALAAGRGGGHGGGGHGGGGHGGGGGRGGGVHIGGGGARFGGAHFGGAPRFTGRGVSRSFARPSRSNRSFVSRGGSNRAAIRANRAASRAARRAGNNAATLNTGNNVNRNLTARGTRDANRRTAAVRNALHSGAVAGALHNRAALRDPNARSRITANAAMAGRQGRDGWWRHRHGGFGWVGPLFWPFAYYDFYNYALWGDGYDYSFWDYGYNDIYAGLFAPYGYDDLAGYGPQYSGPVGSGGVVSSAPATTGSTSTADPAAQSSELAQMCGQDGRDIAGLPIDQIQQVIQPNDEQRAALDDLANASVKAQQDIKAACPTSIALTAPNRLAAMQNRLEALIAAVQTVQPALDKFYGLLNDEQKARLTALGRRDGSKMADASQTCGAPQPGITDWPTAKINDTLQPTEAQRASLTALQDASAKAAELLKVSCQPATALTPPARLAAAGQRLDTMLQAVKTVSVALNDFYGKLTDEQKAQFEAIGPKQTDLSSDTGRRSDASDTGAPEPRRYRHHVNAANIRAMIRHFISW
ncbi:MAG: Spy/CpxP family protein refolding chaperone [Xanthobacteraceae bacterium]|nr:Spy/CpxP family protein refolding chaperone [Xanthobacteraceae bacterium]